MLGSIINLLNASDRTSTVLGGFTLASNGVSMFGPGRGTNSTVTVSGLQKLTDLANIETNSSGTALTAGNLNFTNLTVDGTLVFNSRNYNATGGFQPAAITDTYPLILRCSNKLTITSNGHISADGQGSINLWGSGRIDEQIICPIPVKDVITQSLGYSASSQMFDRLIPYGSQLGFLDQKTYLCGAAGYHYHYYKHNRWSHHHTHGSSYSFNSCGDYGYCPSNYGGRRSRMSGPAGGFVALYFSHLIIDGKEYGVDPDCDISVIQANGVYPAQAWDGTTKGGGMIIIAAKTIEISTRNSGSNTINKGAITANGAITNDESFTSNVKQWRWSIMNNYPQLCMGQTGWYIAKIQDQYKYIWGVLPGDGSIDEAQPFYYFDKGMGEYGEVSTLSGYSSSPEHYTSSSRWAGGAGIALGFKIRED